MDRRQFMRRCAAVGGALLGRDALSFSRKNLGLGDGHESTINPVLPRSTLVSGRVVGVDGTTVDVALRDARTDSPVQLRVVRRTYPAGEAVTAVTTDSVRPAEGGDSSTVRIEVPRRGRTPDPWFYEVQVRPAGSDDPFAYLCESRPFQWPSATGKTLSAVDRVTDGHGPSSGEWYERRLDGNDYALTFRWLDPVNATWELNYRVRRSTHEAAVAGDRGYVETYEESLDSPVVENLANAFEARAHTFAGPDGESLDESEQKSVASLDEGRRFDALVRFVQRIEYLRDADSMGTYDYNRTVPETLVAGVGDCKDRTHLLSGLLAASFDCEPVLLFQAGHLLLGVDADDVPELPYEVESVTLGGRELVPVEPSLRVPVGYYTDEPFVAAYGDGEWFYHDVTALGDGVDDVVQDWFDKTDWTPNLV